MYITSLTLNKQHIYCFSFFVLIARCYKKLIIIHFIQQNLYYAICVSLESVLFDFWETTLIIFQCVSVSQFLDEVELEIETCDTPRPPNSPAHVASYRSGGKYGFVDRVIDGMYVHINSVLVKFISRKFHASLQVIKTFKKG